MGNFLGKRCGGKREPIKHDRQKVYEAQEAVTDLDIVQKRYRLVLLFVQLMNL